MENELGNFYLKREEPVRSCMLALREIVLGFDERITEGWKYKLPFFLFKGKMFVYLWKDKKSGWPYLGVMEGRQIEHPLLVQGDRARVKVMAFDPEADLPIEGIEEVLRLAVACYPP